MLLKLYCEYDIMEATVIDKGVCIQGCCRQRLLYKQGVCVCTLFKIVLWIWHHGCDGDGNCYEQGGCIQLVIVETHPFLDLWPMTVETPITGPVTNDSRDTPITGPVTDDGKDSPITGPVTNDSRDTPITGPVTNDSRDTHHWTCDRWR